MGYYHISQLKVLHMNILMNIIMLKQYSSPQTQDLWTHMESHIKKEDNSIGQKGEMIYPHQQKEKLLYERNVYDSTVTAEWYDKAIDKALD